MRKGVRKFYKSNYNVDGSSLSGYKLQIAKIKQVWIGEQFDDFGLLRIFRLVIVTSLLFSMGVLIDEIFRNKTSLGRKIVTEFYVLGKTIYPLLILVNSWYDNFYLVGLAVYFLLDTYIYLFSKIFLEFQHLKSSNIRTLLMLVLNFFESGLTFAVIYMAGDYLNLKIDNVVDAIYFSFITSATVGYGDIHPVNNEGKLLSILQIFSSISFFVLFFNFFSGKSNQDE